jgi:hypothetical protein
LAIVWGFLVAGHTKTAEAKTEAKKPVTKNGIAKFTTVNGKWNKDWPSFGLLEIVQSVADPNPKIEIGQRQTTVFLRHEDLPRQIVTLFRESPKSCGGLYSKFMTEVEPNSQGLRMMSFRDLSNSKIQTILRRLVKRADASVKRAAGGGK